MEHRTDSMDILEKNINMAMLRIAPTVLEEAKRTGTDIVIWENGGVKHVPPDEMEVRLRVDTGHERHPDENFDTFA